MSQRFRIEKEERRLLDFGQPVHLRRKTFDLLTFLVRNEGRLLSQRTLYEALWPNRCVSDTLLKGCVRELRRALGDDPRRPTFIETVAGHGYRFLGGICCGQVAVRSGPAAWTDSLPSVAVLPVVAGAGGELGECARIVVQEVGAALSQYERVRVVAAPDTFAHGWRQHRVRAIGRYLGAGHLVIGAIYTFGPRLRLNMQLVQAESGHSLWRCCCDCAPGSGLARAARAVAGQVAARLREQARDRALRCDPASMTAYDHVLFGEHRPATTAEDNLAARQHYLRAMELDPACAPAWAGLAHSHVIEGLFQYAPDYQRCLDTALEAANEACERGPGSAKAAWVLGHVLSLRGEAHAARRAFGRALGLAPADADIHVMFGMAQLLAGQPEQAMASHRRALRLKRDPPGWYLWNAGVASYHRGSYAEALCYLEPFVARRPRFMRPRYALAANYAMIGRTADAERAIAPVLASDRSASLARERAHMLTHHRADDGIVDRWLEGLFRAGLRSS